MLPLFAVIHRHSVLALRLDYRLSLTRMKDRQKNCLSRGDELYQTQVQIEKSSVRVRRHRFVCPDEEGACLSVTRMGAGFDQSQNGRDQLWTGMRRTLLSMKCNNQRQEECSLLLQHIDQWERSTRQN